MEDDAGESSHNTLPRIPKLRLSSVLSPAPLSYTSPRRHLRRLVDKASVAGEALSKTGLRPLPPNSDPKGAGRFAGRATKREASWGTLLQTVRNEIVSARAPHGDVGGIVRHVQQAVDGLERQGHAIRAAAAHTPRLLAISEAEATVAVILHAAKDSRRAVEEARNALTTDPDAILVSILRASPHNPIVAEGKAWGKLMGQLITVLQAAAADPAAADAAHSLRCAAARTGQLLARLGTTVSTVEKVAVRHSQALKTAHANMEDRMLAVTRERDDLSQIVRRASAKSVEGYEGDLKEFHAAIVQARDRAELLTKALFRVPTGPGDATALEVTSDTFRHAHDLMVKFEGTLLTAERRASQLFERYRSMLRDQQAPSPPQHADAPADSAHERDRAAGQEDGSGSSQQALRFNYNKVLKAALNEARLGTLQAPAKGHKATAPPQKPPTAADLPQPFRRATRNDLLTFIAETIPHITSQSLAWQHGSNQLHAFWAATAAASTMRHGIRRVNLMMLGLARLLRVHHARVLHAYISRAREARDLEHAVLPAFQRADAVDSADSQRKERFLCHARALQDASMELQLSATALAVAKRVSAEAAGQRGQGKRQGKKKAAPKSAQRVLELQEGGLRTVLDLAESTRAYMLQCDALAVRMGNGDPQTPVRALLELVKAVAGDNSPQVSEEDVIAAEVELAGAEPARQLRLSDLVGEVMRRAGSGHDEATVAQQCEQLMLSPTERMAAFSRAWPDVAGLWAGRLAAARRAMDARMSVQASPSLFSQVSRRPLWTLQERMCGAAGRQPSPAAAPRFSNPGADARKEKAAQEVAQRLEAAEGRLKSIASSVGRVSSMAGLFAAEGEAASTGRASPSPSPTLTPTPTPTPLPQPPPTRAPTLPQTPIRRPPPVPAPAATVDKTLAPTPRSTSIPQPTPMPMPAPDETPLPPPAPSPHHHVSGSGASALSLPASDAAAPCSPPVVPARAEVQRKWGLVKEGIIGVIRRAIDGITPEESRQHVETVSGVLDSAAIALSPAFESVPLREVAKQLKRANAEVAYDPRLGLARLQVVGPTQVGHGHGAADAADTSWVVQPVERLIRAAIEFGLARKTSLGPGGRDARVKDRFDSLAVVNPLDPPRVLGAGRHARAESSADRADRELGFPVNAITALLARRKDVASLAVRYSPVGPATAFSPEFAVVSLGQRGVDARLSIAVRPEPGQRPTPSQIAEFVRSYAPHHEPEVRPDHVDVVCVSAHALVREGANGARGAEEEGDAGDDPDMLLAHWAALRCAGVAPTSIPAVLGIPDDVYLVRDEGGPGGQGNRDAADRPRPAVRVTSRGHEIITRPSSPGPALRPLRWREPVVLRGGLRAELPNAADRAHLARHAALRVAEALGASRTLFVHAVESPTPCGCALESMWSRGRVWRTLAKACSSPAPVGPSTVPLGARLLAGHLRTASAGKEAALARVVGALLRHCAFSSDAALPALLLLLCTCSFSGRGAEREVLRLVDAVDSICVDAGAAVEKGPGFPRAAAPHTCNECAPQVKWLGSVCATSLEVGTARALVLLSQSARRESAQFAKAALELLSGVSASSLLEGMAAVACGGDATSTDPGAVTLFLVLSLRQGLLAAPPTARGDGDC